MRTHRMGWTTLAVAASLFAAWVAPAEAGLPGDCIALVRVKSLDRALKDMGEFAAQIQPGMNDQMLAMLLGQALRNPTLNGIDRSKPVVAVLLDPMQYGTKAVALVMPISDRAQFEQALVSGAMTKADRPDGLTSFTTPRGKELLMAYAEAQVVVAWAAPVCQSALSLCQEGQLALPPTAPAVANSTIAVYVDVAKVWGTYKPMVTGMVEGMKMRMRNGLQQQARQQGMDPEMMVKIVEAEMGWWVSLLDQSEAWSAGVALSAAGATAHSRWTLKSGTPIGNWLAAQKPSTLELLHCLPQDVILGGTMRIRAWQQALGWYWDFVELMAGKAAPEVMPTMRTATEEWLLAIDEEIAFALVEPSSEAGGIEVVYAVAIKDHAKAKELIGRLPEYVEASNKMNAQLGTNTQVEFTANVGTYRGYAIHAYETKIDWGKASPQAAPMMADLVGKTMRGEFSLVKNRIVAALGKNARKRLTEQVDLVLDGGPSLADSAAMQEVFGSMPKDQSAVGMLAPAALLRLVKQFAPIPPRVKYESPAGIGFTCRLSANTVDEAMIVPMKEIVAIQQAVVAAKMGPQGDAPAPAAPAP